MRLFLIRHAETVDNVAGIYAGVRNSALTIHGVEQARRLGAHLAQNRTSITHIFASPLSRATKTAQAIQKAQLSEVQLVQASDLVEQDFGYYEGKPFHARTTPKLSGRDAHRKDHRNDPGFVDVETKDAMAKRCDRFLDEHLMGLFGSGDDTRDMTVAVVSHGILLSNLWRRLLLRLPRRSITIASEIKAMRDDRTLEHLGGWSNTGYLELLFEKHDAEHAAVAPTEGPSPANGAVVVSSATLVNANELSVPINSDPYAKVVEVAQSREKSTGVANQKLLGWSVTIVAIDSKEHLIGLKRQRGGIGSLAHDDGQRKLDGFFKKQRTT